MQDHSNDMLQMTLKHLYAHWLYHQLQSRSPCSILTHFGRSPILLPMKHSFVYILPTESAHPRLYSAEYYSPLNLATRLGSMSLHPPSESLRPLQYKATRPPDRRRLGDVVIRPGHLESVRRSSPVPSAETHLSQRHDIGDVQILHHCGYDGSTEIAEDVESGPFIPLQHADLR